MTALGDLSPKAEDTQGSRGKENTKKPVRRFLPGAIMKLFRAVKNAVTPHRKPTRRRSGETRGGFRLLAHKLTRKVIARTVFDDPGFWLRAADPGDEAQHIQQWHENNIDLHSLEEGHNLSYAEQSSHSLNL
jgi:hypothetical protein